MVKIVENNIIRDMTSKEEAQYNIDQQEYQDNVIPNKLKEIKEMRLEKLKETDYLALSDVTLSDAWKNKRQSWRDIPQDFTTEQYDSLLARDSDGNLTHSIWSKP
tara:strand:- start:54 stop:368 length:315 start_codon:yes stop_codon:yes gene_type:complete